jgi:hypothetical protein
MVRAIMNRMKRNGSQSSNDRNTSKSSDSPKRLTWLSGVDAVLALLLFALSLRIFSEAMRDSWDFLVYWRSIRAWMTGAASPYAITNDVHGFVFKYPPWTIPFFVPFVMASAGTAKLIWCICNLFALTYTHYWLFLQGVSLRISMLATLLFWRFWISYFNAGQITLLLLGIALFAVQPQKKQNSVTSPFRLSILVLTLTSKIFSSVTLLGVCSKLLNRRVALLTAGLFALNIIIVLGVMNLHGHPISVFELFSEWLKASSSGGTELGAEIIRSNNNTGFPAALLRLLKVAATLTWADAVASLFCSIILSILWVSSSHPLSEGEKWLGWISIGLVAHPLAWQHSFVLAFPLFALSLDRAISRAVERTSKSQHGWEILWVLIAYFWMDMRYPAFLGAYQALICNFVEGISIKSWGVVLLGGYLIYTKRKLQFDSRSSTSSSHYEN